MNIQKLIQTKPHKIGLEIVLDFLEVIQTETRIFRFWDHVIFWSHFLSSIYEFHFPHFKTKVFLLKKTKGFQSIFQIFL